MKAHRSGSHHRLTRPDRKATSSPAVGVRALLEHHGHQRPLAPPLVGHGDDGGFDHPGMGHDLVLQLDRRDPLAARLDHVLGPVADLHEAEAVERTDVPGAEPSVMEPFRSRLAVVGAGDPRAPHLELADRFTVVGEDRPVLVDDPDLDPGHHPARLGPPLDLLFVGHALGRQGQRADRAGLGHAPPLDQLDTELVTERLDQLSWHRRPAGRDHPQGRQVGTVGAGVAEQVVPDGGHAGRDGRAVSLDDGDQRRRLEELLGHDQVGTGHEGGVRGPPGVGVEHGDDGRAPDRGR